MTYPEPNSIQDIYGPGDDSIDPDLEKKITKRESSLFWRFVFWWYLWDFIPGWLAKVMCNYLWPEELYDA